MSSEDGGKPKALQLRPSMESLGLVLSFICRSSPYAEFRAGKIIAAVQHQLSTRSHVCLVEGERIIAYAGWLPVSEADAEAWLKGEAGLRPVPPDATDAAALTIVSAADRAHVTRLIRACRTLIPQHNVYFKRDYAAGQARKAKLRVFRPG
jgi:hemolysin-activating ACP:hemolysin acyltransferase